MIEPDLPMTPPMREEWQRRRKRKWPLGTVSGRGGGLVRVEEALLAAA